MWSVILYLQHQLYITTIYCCLSNEIMESELTVVYYLAFHSTIMDFSAQNGCNCVQVFILKGITFISLNSVLISCCIVFATPDLAKYSK